MYRSSTRPEGQLQHHCWRQLAKASCTGRSHLPIIGMSEKNHDGGGGGPWAWLRLEPLHKSFTYLPFENTSLLFSGPLISPKEDLGHLVGQGRAKLSCIPLETRHGPRQLQRILISYYMESWSWPSLYHQQGIGVSVEGQGWKEERFVWGL